MRGLLDFGSWSGLPMTLAGIALVTLVAVGIRLLVMQTVQQRRARENRQVNERLRTLIAAYKTLGGSFTGDLLVDPAHLRELREAAATDGAGFEDTPGGERRRRIRDAVEAALSDVILLGTEEQVRLAARAASELAAGRPVETAELVVSLRNFIREVPDLDPVPRDVAIPRQGALRPAGGGGRGGGADRGSNRGGGRAGAGAAAGGAGMGAGLGAGLSRSGEGVIDEGR
jgi:heme exporter protein D